MLTGSLADYLMPTASDFPFAPWRSSKPSPHNPLGAKGAGEGGIIPVGGVVANAVADALSAFGVEPRELPLSPPRVWQLIQPAPLIGDRHGAFDDAAGRAVHALEGLLRIASPPT